MRVIVRKERPHPGAQLRLTDVDGLRITAFATNTARGQLAELELRHRRRARCEDRIRCAKDTGLTNLPLHDLNQNRIWCAVVTLACELLAWLQLLTLVGHQARRWDPSACACGCSARPWSSWSAKVPVAGFPTARPCLRRVLPAWSLPPPRRQERGTHFGRQLCTCRPWG